jgi:hypothetical protein
LFVQERKRLERIRSRVHRRLQGRDPSDEVSDDAHARAVLVRGRDGSLIMVRLSLILFSHVEGEDS